MTLDIPFRSPKSSGVDSKDIRDFSLAGSSRHLEPVVQAFHSLQAAIIYRISTTNLPPVSFYKQDVSHHPSSAVFQRPQASPLRSLHPHRRRRQEWQDHPRSRKHRHYDFELTRQRYQLTQLAQVDAQCIRDTVGNGQLSHDTIARDRLESVATVVPPPGPSPNPFDPLASWRRR